MHLKIPKYSIQFEKYAKKINYLKIVMFKFLSIVIIIRIGRFFILTNGFFSQTVKHIKPCS